MSRDRNVDGLGSPRRGESGRVGFGSACEKTLYSIRWESRDLLINNGPSARIRDSYALF